MVAGSAIKVADQHIRIDEVGAPMTIRKRKLIGTILLLAFILVYAMLALAVAVVLQVNQVSKLAELAFYAIAGLIWIIPAGAIISWMGRPDSTP